MIVSAASPPGPLPFLRMLGVLVFFLSGVLFGRGLLAPGPSPPHDAAFASRPVADRPAMAKSEEATIELFRRTAPSAVHVTNLAIGRDRWTRNLMRMPQGAGSGIVWSDEGYVVTNYHVLEQGQGFEVTLDDQSVWDARVVGARVGLDVAVLKIDAPADRLQPVAVGRSADLQVGQQVFAIGNPFGLDQSLTSGIISGLGRQIQAPDGRSIDGVIQTDAAINPGNSGGPLFDSAGHLVGMNTAIASPTGAYAGIGFAVPVDHVHRAVTDIIRGVERPALGIRPADDSIARKLGRQGVVILEVVPNSGAARAGLTGVRVDQRREILLGDVIVGVDSKPIRDLNDLFDALDDHEPGDVVDVTVERSGETRTTQVRLQRLDP